MTVRLKAAAPPSASTACCSHVFPTKPCGHIVSETNLTATGMGSIATAAAERAAAVPVGSMAACTYSLTNSTEKFCIL